MIQIYSVSLLSWVSVDMSEIILVTKRPFNAIVVFVLQKKKKGVSRRLHSELLEQARILGEHLRMPSLDTDDVLVTSIMEYLQCDVPWPLVVHGGPGSGKSKVLATATHMCSLWLPNAHLVFRFAHRTRESRSVERLLTNVIEQCCLLLGEPRPSGVQVRFSIVVNCFRCAQEFFFSSLLFFCFDCCVCVCWN